MPDRSHQTSHVHRDAIMSWRCANILDAGPLDCCALRQMRLATKLNENLASEICDLRICDSGDSRIRPNIRPLVASHSQGCSRCLSKTILSRKLPDICFSTLLATAVFNERSKDVNQSLSSYCLNSERCDDGVFVEWFVELRCELVAES